MGEVEELGHEAGAKLHDPKWIAAIAGVLALVLLYLSYRRTQGSSVAATPPMQSMAPMLPSGQLPSGSIAGGTSDMSMLADALGQETAAINQLATSVNTATPQSTVSGSPLASNPFAGGGDLTPAQDIVSWYEQYLGRAPESSQATNGWLALYNNKSWTLDQIQSGIENSPEAFQYATKQAQQYYNQPQHISPR